ncbi:hypothetical protein OEZ85_003919 [Tetradesmus obliquus]|uniref:Uncharacterized protein n=1 Tax=Tetradesmus obliquus TaxID=3088 RepID=A0ABY8UCU3_TETOB|nr:hypothetical protein OEZ85_003919 [Tetradesmus obliquus]
MAAVLKLPYDPDVCMFTCPAETICQYAHLVPGCLADMTLRGQLPQPNTCHATFEGHFSYALVAAYVRTAPTAYQLLAAQQLPDCPLRDLALGLVEGAPEGWEEEAFDLSKGRSYYNHQISCVYVKAYAYCMPLHLCKQLVIGFGPGGAPAAAAASGRLASIALKLRPKLPGVISVLAGLPRTYTTGGKYRKGRAGP